MNMFHRWPALTLFALLVASFAVMGACSSEDGAADGGGEIDTYPYTIVTTTGMISDIVEQVAGEHAEVSALMGEGIDPHLYSPTRGDVNRILGADVVFYNGLTLEGRMGDLFVRAARRGRPIYAVTEMLDRSTLLNVEDPTAGEDESGYLDPHVWMDVSLWADAVGVVAEALAEVDPSHAEDYEQNAAEYREQLEALDEYARRTIATIPERQRTMITAHDAFAYLGRAYDIEVVGVQGLSTESSAGLADINRLVDLLVDNKIDAVFAESSVPDRNVRALIDGAEARDHTVTIGGTLYSDAMGPAGTYTGTYIGMIDHNVTTIARALGGEAPETGFQDKLTSVD